MYTRLGYLDENERGECRRSFIKKRFFVSQKNSTIKLNYYLRKISGNRDQYRAKDKNDFPVEVQQEVWSQMFLILDRAQAS